MDKRTILIDDVSYNQLQIKSMETSELKQFVSFLEKERDLNLVKLWSGNEIIEAYIDNLLTKI